MGSACFYRAILVVLACAALLGSGANAQDKTAVRPATMAPGTNAVIEVVETSGWSTPEDLKTGIDAGAVPAGLRRLWTDEARRLQRMATTKMLKASRSGGVLMLALKGGRTLKFFDQGIYGSITGDGDRYHVLVDVPLAANLYAVHVTMNEFAFYWLIPASTGAMTSLTGMPVLSPDLRRAFGFRDELMNGRELEIVSIGPDQVVRDKVEWQPDNEPDTQYTLGWTADGLAITVVEIRQKTRRANFRLVLKDGAWRRE